MMIDSQAALRFRRFGMLTLFVVYLVILAGGTVRASGAGMGCPDWPTCFGQWIPPTDVSELPANYHEIYALRGYQNTDFNPIKTWTEYTNRLVGVSFGFLMLFTTWLARHFLKTDKPVFFITLSVLLLGGFQAWLGSAVVASNLKPLMISIHMLMALVLVGLLIYAIARSQREAISRLNVSHLPEPVYTVINVVMGMTLLQIAMGVQVREAVDFISHAFTQLDRQYWRDSFPVVFYVHRSFSSIILFTNLWMCWKIYQSVEKNSLLMKLAFTLMSLIAIAILAGISLDRLAMPRVAQPIHLLMANLIFGVQFFMFICLRYARKS
jgi:cytochrome c oxidase assembly protein subunit 15